MIDANLAGISPGEFVPSADMMPQLLHRFQMDRGTLERKYGLRGSAAWRERYGAFLTAWEHLSEQLDIAPMSANDRVDRHLFRLFIRSERRRCALEERRWDEIKPFVGFLDELIAMAFDRCAGIDRAPEVAAQCLDHATVEARRLRKAPDETGAGKPAVGATSAVALRAAGAVEAAVRILETWYGFYAGYDPHFDWWMAQPWRAFTEEMKRYAACLRGESETEELTEELPGDPVGREELEQDLADALIDATPEALIELAAREQAWCLQEMRLAAREMGFGDDWHAALDKVKETHVAPGQQPALVRDLAREATDYVETHGLVTVPAIAREGWRMEMMSAEMQKVNPFFLGGETIIVSYPTGEMNHADKRMSLRGNNPAFSRATVQHELIPGHHLQGFFQDRYRPYRQLFYTPFWTEGWTLHWEMLLWERRFARTPEERIGMLFWRLHRAVRVLFSLGFHLGQLTARQCVDMLIEQVGHEPRNAEAEVRRSFAGDYPPLYQCAYLIGGLQVHALYREMVETNGMAPRKFHDAFLKANSMPIALVRALLLEATIDPERPPLWRFTGNTA